VVKINRQQALITQATYFFAGSPQKDRHNQKFEKRLRDKNLVRQAKKFSPEF